MKEKTKSDKNYVILFLFSLLFCLPVFFSSDSVFEGDIKYYWFVTNSFFSESFSLYGEMPLWNPTIYSGTAVLGDPQTLFLSPLYPLFILFDFSLAIKISLFFLLFVSGISMFFLLKTFSLKKEASLFGAIAFMFSGKIMATIIIGHINMWIVYALLPLVFAFSLLALEKKPLQYGVFTGVVLSLMFLGGHTQIFVYSFLAFCFFLLFKLIDSMKSFSAENFISTAKKILAFLLPALIIFLLLSSVKILPLFEFFSESSRGTEISLEQANFDSIRVENLVSVVSPNFFGNPVNHTFWGRIFYHELIFFPGVIALLLAVFAVLFNRNKLTKFFSLLLLFSLIFSFGSALFLFDVFRLLPFFSSFRIPARMLFIASFCVPVIAALGLNKLIEIKILEKKQKFYFNAVFGIGAVSGIAVSSMFFFKEQIFELGEKILLQKYAEYSLAEQEYFISRIPEVFNWISRDLASFFIFTMCFSVLIFFFIKKNKLSKKHFSLLLISLCFLELAFFGFAFVDLKNPEMEKSQSIDFIQEQEGYFRVFDYKLFEWYPKTAGTKIQTVFSYNPTIHKKYIEFIALINNKSAEEIIEKELAEIHFGELTEKSNTKILDLLNAKYIVSKEELSLDSFPLVFQDENYFVYENKAFLPRAFVVGNARVLDSEKEVYETISSDLFNPREEVLLSKGKEIDSVQEFKQAEIEYYSPNKIIVSVSLEDKGYLVLSEKNYPGWKAFECGKELEIVTANYISRAVRLDKGNHKIEFVFLPESVFYGSLLSILGVVLVIGYTGLNFLRYKKKTKIKEQLI